MFVSDCVYVMFEPAETGSGASLFVTVKSAVAHEEPEEAPAIASMDDNNPLLPLAAPKLSRSCVVMPLAPPLTSVVPAAAER